MKSTSEDYGVQFIAFLVPGGGAEAVLSILRLKLNSLVKSELGSKNLKGTGGNNVEKG